MKRVEIIANRSVQDEITEALEARIDGFYYTVIPVVHGRGDRGRRLGTSTWPEENFMLIAYVEEATANIVARVVGEVKTRFPTEGIRVFNVE